jgi:hypothetical protein
VSSTPVSPPIGYLQLVRQNPDFRNLWLGQIVSLAGDWFNLVASVFSWSMDPRTPGCFTG